jgi:hypothetical protein
MEHGSVRREACSLPSTPIWPQKAEIASCLSTSHSAVSQPIHGAYTDGFILTNYRQVRRHGTNTIQCVLLMAYVCCTS